MASTVDHSSRAHALLNASSASRWLACPPSAVAAEAYPETETVYTEEGTRAHELAEIVTAGRENEITAEEAETYPAEMIEAAYAYASYIDELKKSDDAVVLLETKVDFSPWVPQGFGTCDCLLIQGTTLSIVDFKYGMGVPVSAEGNPQMMLYALGALNDYGFAYDVETVEMHIFQPRIDNISRAEISVADLMEWAEKTVKPVAAQAIKGKGTYTPGAHCKFCPHAGKCRKLSQLCTMTVMTHGLKAKVETLAPHEVQEVLDLELMISLWLKRVKTQAMNDMLSGKEIPGYKVVEGKLGNRKWTDELDVAGTLKAAGFAPEDYTETKLLSPAAMDKSLGKKRVAELLTDYIMREPGSPTVVPATDKRPAYNPLAQAQEDFK